MMNSIEMELLPTEQEIRDYEERGWYISRPLFDDDLLARIRLAIEDHQAGRRDHALPNAVKGTDWKTGDGDGLRSNEFCSLQSARLRELAWSPLIGAIAARLARTSQIRLFVDQIIFKPAFGSLESTVVGWHTDQSYWSTCTSTSMLTAWVPLEKTTIDTGTLTVVEGSHLWPETEHLRGFKSGDLKWLEQKLGREIPQSSIIPLLLNKGQVSFHHMRTLHGSTDNLTANPRIAVAVHLQDNENHYRTYKTSDGNAVVIPHDQVCRPNAQGDPDYSDPRAFPVLWPVAENR